MSVISKKELDTHRHHKVILTGYIVGGAVLECITCNEVLLEFHDDKYGMIQLGVHPELIDNFDNKDN